VKVTSHQIIQQWIDGAVGMSQQDDERQNVQCQRIFFVEVSVQTDVSRQHTHTKQNTNNNISSRSENELSKYLHA